MTTYSVHLPPGVVPGTPEAVDKAAFVKDGWSWPAFLIPPLWLLWRRMWLPFLLWLGLTVAIGVGASLAGLTAATASLVQAVFSIWFGLEANALRRWSLDRKGWRFLGLAAGADLGEAELRFFSREEGVAPPAHVPARAPAASLPAQRGEPVIGLFPEPWNRPT